MQTLGKTIGKADSHGLLGRYPVEASGFHLIGKETERGWEQAEDISTLLPSLVRMTRTQAPRNELRDSVCSRFLSIRWKKKPA